MSSSYDDSVMNFDLGFLHQNSKNTGLSRLEKQRKAILIAKQKTITTDSLIRKYYNKKEILEQTERTLFASKEECKQVCIDYKNVLEKCERLENEIQVIQHYNQQLQQKLSNAENQFCGIQSHARQLEVLVKEQETQIESLKIENHLEKTNIKNFATSSTSLQKQNDILIQDICILGKLLSRNKKLKPAHKAILQKYEKNIKQDYDSCNDSGGETSDNEMDIFEDNLMSPLSPNETDKGAKKIQSSSVEVQEVIVVNLNRTINGDASTRKPDESDRCSDCSNEIASADTGRGSSLAFSDSEKCFRSPDYFLNDNHDTPETIRKSTVDVNSIGTSPIRESETIDTATSPISFETPHVPNITIDRAISPVKSINVESVPNLNEARTSLMVDESTQNEDNNQHMVSQEVECLQVNSSNHYNDDNSRDCEVEMILSKMQFNHELITPIPSTPYSSRNTINSKVSGCQTNHNDFIICHDAAKLREENKILHANIADLAKEIVNIKSMLKLNPLVLAERNQNQENVSDVEADVIESNLPYQMNDVNETRKSQNENNIDKDDLIDIVDLIQICANDDLELNDLRDINDREQVQNDEDISNCSTHSLLLEDPIVITQEQDNTTEGIISRLEFESDTISSPIHCQPENVTDVNSTTLDRTVNGDLIAETLPSSNENVRRRRLKNKTKLEKLRRKMIVKCKIRKERPVAIKKRLIKKQLVKSIKNAKKITPADTSVSLNDKTVYNNAVRVMAELKSKQSEESLIKSNRNKSMAGDLTPIQIKKSCNMSEITAKSVKKHVLEKCSIKSTDKPFSISDLISETTPRPVLKTVSAAHNTNKCSGKAEQEKGQSLKTIQPIQEKEIEQEITCVDKTRHSENNKISQSLSPSVTTRSRSRFIEKPQTDVDSSTSIESATNEKLEILSKEGRKRHKVIAADEPQEIEHKRILRSTTRQSNCESFNTNMNNSYNKLINTNEDNIDLRNSKSRKENVNNMLINDMAHKDEYNAPVSYGDLDMFNDQAPKKTKNTDTSSKVEIGSPKDSILCTMLEKYSLCKINSYPKKIPDGIINSIFKLFDDSIKQINELTPNETKTAMDDFVENLQSWNVKQFLAGFMKYLQDPQRKIELYSKVHSPPAPPMTKTEQILIYVVMQLKTVWSTVDLVNYVLRNIEYILFRLNRTPEFDTIESMSHFYAVLCRYFKMKTRLRLFMLDAMYCLQYKAIALIRQCMDVWMHVLPLAHMGIAKNPLVTCVVYLLHFYKCEDHFNRVQDIRNILNRKYSYQMSEWNETRILEMFKNAVCDVRDIPVEKKMLRLSLIILAKRQGARWSQKNLITNMLQPIIEKNDTPEIVKHFCVSMIGPLIKPYPADMKVHCEIVMNLLLDMIKQNPSPSIEEAIFTSLIYMSKHNQNRVISALLSWHPKQVSAECQQILRDFVRDKPVHAWKAILSKININAEMQNRTEH